MQGAVVVRQGVDGGAGSGRDANLTTTMPDGGATV